MLSTYKTYITIKNRIERCHGGICSISKNILSRKERRLSINARILSRGARILSISVRILSLNARIMN
jgi:hypothetical protein